MILFRADKSRLIEKYDNDYYLLTYRFFIYCTPLHCWFCLCSWWKGVLQLFQKLKIFLYTLAILSTGIDWKARYHNPLLVRWLSVVTQAFGRNNSPVMSVSNVPWNLLDNSRTNRLTVSQVADWSTRRQRILVNYGKLKICLGFRFRCKQF